MTRSLIALAIIIATLLLQQFAEFPVHNAFTNSLTNWMHVAMFACITATGLWLRPQSAPWLIAALAFGLAILSELLQSFSDRQASIIDLGRDALGIAIAVYCYRLPSATLRNYLVTPVAIAVATFAIPSFYLVAYAYHAQIFPVLYQPADLRSSILTTTHADGNITSHHSWSKYAGDEVLHLTWTDEQWPGVHLREPVDDWRAYEILLIDAYNLQQQPQPLIVGVRHHKTGGTSRYQSMQLRPGHNRLRVDLQALAYLDNSEPASIKHLMLYTTRAHKGEQILLGKVWLQ